MHKQVPPMIPINEDVSDCEVCILYDLPDYELIREFLHGHTPFTIVLCRYFLAYLHDLCMGELPVRIGFLLHRYTPRIFTNANAL
jgi:hypothetical protein